MGLGLGNEDDDFEKEKEGLVIKLSSINLNDDLEEVGNSALYKDYKTLKEYDKMNYITCANSKRKIRIKLNNNIIEDLYTFKKNNSFKIISLKKVII